MSGAPYTGHDPATGCGLMLATAVLVAVVILAVLIGALASGLWRP